METLTFDDLLAACRPQGPVALSSVTNLRPAGGWHMAVAPAKFVEAKGKTTGASKKSPPVFAYETRFIDGEPVTVVVIDSKQSSLNRIEQALSIEMRRYPGTADDDAAGQDRAVLRKVPGIQLDYPGQSLFDVDLPHRVFDGHIRAGTIDGEPVTQTADYKRLRDASPANARPLLDHSPISLVLGSWDASRRVNQGKYRSALRGEIIGVLADQSDPTPRSSRSGGARVDPVGPSVQLSVDDLKRLLAEQEHELAPGAIKRINNDIAAAQKNAKTDKSGLVSASRLGLGAIPPALESLGSVACQKILRTHVLSFAALRQLRFGCTGDGDVYARALLAALALAGLARADAELCLRANCDLVEVAPPTVTLEKRYGDQQQLAPLTIEAADALLSEAIAQAAKHAEITWDEATPRLTITGNPLVSIGALADDDEADED